jgi:hypothetical protein
MSEKTIVMVGFVIGSTLGGFIPTLLGASFISYWGIVGSAIGGIAGIYIGYKIAF